MKIAVIYEDATAKVHTGAALERTVRVFDMPPDMADWVTKATQSSYATCTFALVEEPTGGSEP